MPSAHEVALAEIHARRDWPHSSPEAEAAYWGGEKPHWRGQEPPDDDEAEALAEGARIEVDEDGARRVAFSVDPVLALEALRVEQRVVYRRELAPPVPSPLVLDAVVAEVRPRESRPTRRVACASGRGDPDEPGPPPGRLSPNEAAA
jgi:hypothetical protein